MEEGKSFFPLFKNILINHPNTTITNFSLKKEKEKKEKNNYYLQK